MIQGRWLLPLCWGTLCVVALCKTEPHVSQSFKKTETSLSDFSTLQGPRIPLGDSLLGFLPPLSLTGSKDESLGNPTSDQCRPNPLLRNRAIQKPYIVFIRSLKLVNNLNKTKQKKFKNHTEYTRVKTRTRNQKLIAHSYPVIAKDI